MGLEMPPPADEEGVGEQGTAALAEGAWTARRWQLWQKTGSQVVVRASVGDWRMSTVPSPTTPTKISLFL